MADAGYGASGAFRQALADRGLHYIAGVTDEVVVFTEPPAWERPAGRGGVGPAGGRPQSHPRLRPGTPRPIRLRDLAARTPLRRVTWRAGTKGRMSGRFGWVRVWPGFGWKRGECADADPVWVLIEDRADGEIRYALSNLPAGTSRLRAVRLWKSRWPVENPQADYPSSRRWVGSKRIGYHRRDGVARTGRVVPATPGRPHRRSRMSDTTRRRPTPPRA